MKKMILAFLLVLNVGWAAPSTDLLRDGDLIFQTSRSQQSQAITIATHSDYSHCGIIYIENGEVFVFEAVQPVKKTPIREWIARGEKGHFVIKRLKNAKNILTPAVLKKMKHIAQQFTGKSYDLTFGWSDEKMYCSELIWKIYKRATGLEIAQLAQLGDFDLSHPIVKRKLQERYGKHIPKNETVISPKAMYESDLLETVTRN